MQRAETFYKIPGLSQRVLGAPENPAEVLPEETLVGRLQSGQLDAGFFYSTETADAKIPAIALPAGLAPKAVYTVAIVRDAPNPRWRRAICRLPARRGWAKPDETAWARVAEAGHRRGGLRGAAADPILGRPG